VTMSDSLQLLDAAVIVVYLVCVIGLGFWVGVRKKHGGDLFLAGRRLRWPSIGLSLLGTNVQPSMMLAACAVAYGSGMVAANFEWLAWFFLLLLAMVFVPHYLHTKVSTMPEFLELRFNRSCQRFLSWYTLFTTMILWLGGALYAGGLLLHQIMDWPLSVSVLLLVTVATSFTVVGGLAAVVVTDAFQVVLMIVGSAVLVVIGLVKVGTIDHLMAEVPTDYWRLFRDANDPKYPWPAIVLGYPVLGIWFWCTDQTIVQRVLGARDLYHGQRGAAFAGFLKVFTPFLFFLPGILCFVLFPGLEDPDEAYMTMVTELLPAGMVGLIVAVLIAALVSTIDSGLNSFSTVFTLDIYCRSFRPRAQTPEIIWVGRVVTVVAAIVAVLCALAMDTVAKNLFDLLQSIIAYFAPSMSAVFLVGTLWRRATAKAALTTLILGTAVSLSIGACELKDWPHNEYWPHYLLLSFYLFVGCVALMVLISLCTTPRPGENKLPALSETRPPEQLHRSVWVWWGVLGVVMGALYVVFN
jgi:SSS family solute:Na+ symporter